MKEYDLNLSEEEVNAILTLLSKEPYYTVHQLISKIQSQANDQIEQQGEE